MLGGRCAWTIFTLESLVRTAVKERDDQIQREALQRLQAKDDAVDKAILAANLAAWCRRADVLVHARPDLPDNVNVQSKLGLYLAAGRPIAAPSANRFGRISPTTAQHVRDELGDAVALVLDAPFLLVFLAVMFFYSWQLTLIALGSRGEPRRFERAALTIAR